jgi:hypothetical protein
VPALTLSPGGRPVAENDNGRPSGSVAFSANVTLALCWLV